MNSDRWWRFFRWTDHRLDRYGGTWGRTYEFGIRTHAHSWSISFRGARNREVGK